MALIRSRSKFGIDVSTERLKDDVGERSPLLGRLLGRSVLQLLRDSEPRDGRLRLVRHAPQPTQVVDGVHTPKIARCSYTSQYPIFMTA